MSEVTAEQERIKNWFENTYQKRGNLYLRPKAAYEIFLHLLKPQKGQNLLDVACGLGRLLEVGKQYDLNLHGVDLSETAIQSVKEILPEAVAKVGNAEALPFDDNSMDMITCLGSLERIINLENALKEQLRVGKPTAKYCYMVRNSNRASWKLVKNGLGIKNEAGHQGAKTLEEWSDIFRKVGFEIEQVVSDQWGRMRIWRYLGLGIFHPDYKTPKKGLTPLENAYEFIFVLRKK